MPGRWQPPRLLPRHLAHPPPPLSSIAPRPLSHHDQEAWCPLPPGAHLAPRGDIRAGIGKGGRTHGYCGGLQNVREGRLFLSIGGCCPGGGGEGPGSGGGGVFVPLEPLEDLGVCLVLTSIPPFLPSAALLPALSTLGKPVSVISPLPLGCKDHTLCHVLSFRRQVQLLPPPVARDGEALEGSFLVPYQGARYRVYYSTGEARCYLCRSAGHVRRDCPLAQQGGAPETPETWQNIGSVFADAPGHPTSETTSSPARSTAAPARAQETPPLQRPDERGSPALAVNNPAEPMEEGAAKILPGIGEGPPQGELPPAHAASPLPPRAPEPSPLPSDATPANQPPDDAMEGWTLVQRKRRKQKARAPLHPSDAVAPRKTRKGGTDNEPSAMPTSEIHLPVSGGEDKIALEGRHSPPQETLPSEIFKEAPSA
ncbi:unnamed protein product [Eretmochelys imbricata]